MTLRGIWKASILIGATALYGCASSGPVRTDARVEVDEAVGFTIVEELQVGGNVRADWSEALALLEQGHTERGIALLGTVVEAAPHSSAPRIDLAVAHHRAGQLDKAEAHLRAALAVNGDHPVAHNELGIVLRKTGRMAEARASYEAALAVFPGFHYARRNLAVLCDLYLADLTCAAENYEAYLATVQADEEAQMWLADVHLRMNEAK